MSVAAPRVSPADHPLVGGLSIRHSRHCAARAHRVPSTASRVPGCWPHAAEREAAGAQALPHAPVCAQRDCGQVALLVLSQEVASREEGQRRGRVRE